MQLNAGGSGFRLYDSPNINLFGLLGLDTCLFLGPSGSNWWSSLLQCFGGVADPPGISMFINAL